METECFEPKAKFSSQWTGLRCLSALNAVKKVIIYMKTLKHQNTTASSVLERSINVSIPKCI